MKPQLSILFFLIFISLNAQQGVFSGKIIDAKTNLPIPYVNIICKDVQNNLISGGITNNEGVFTITKLPLKKVIVEIQFIGYQNLKKEIILSLKTPQINLGTLKIDENNTVLNEVEIQAETSTITQKIDRKIFNIGKDLGASGTNSLEMLNNIPSISVDFQSGSVNLRGNQNVRVLIDGKPSNLSAFQLLKQIPSSSVKNVELITNPSAKYTPEGMSGIINIVLKKNTTIGFNGSFTLGAAHSINTRPTGSLDLNYRNGSVNFYGNYSIDEGKFETKTSFNRTDKDLNQAIDYLDNSISHYTKAGIDFYIDKKNTLSIYTTQSFEKSDFSINTKTTENSNLIFSSPNLSTYDVYEAAYNADYKLNLDDKGHYIEVEVNYSKNKNPQIDTLRDLINPSSNVYNYRNNIQNDNSIFLVNLDYTKPIKGGNLELGLEARTQKVFNSIVTNQEIETGGTPATQPIGNSSFNYDREIYSAYVNYTKEYKKIALQAGLRFENFSLEGLFANTQQTNLEPFTDNIFSIYPSAYFTFYPSEKNEFQIGYSRRVDRPGIDQVTPIQEWSSALTVSVGNRTLKPQFTNSFELNYTRNIKNGYLTFGAFYRKTSDKIGRILKKDSINLDRQILSYTNYNTSDSYGIEFSSSFKPTKWWTIMPSYNMYIQESQGIINNTNETIKNTFFRTRLSNNFKASKRLRFQLSASYRGKSENIQFKIDPFFIINASARLSVFKGKGSINLRGTDIFDGYQLNFSATNPFSQTGHSSLEYSAIYLGFSYNFGNGKNRERERKYREKNETQGSGGVY